MFSENRLRISGVVLYYFSAFSTQNPITSDVFFFSILQFPRLGFARKTSRSQVLFWMCLVMLRDKKRTTCSAHSNKALVKGDTIYTKQPHLPTLKRYVLPHADTGEQNISQHNHLIFMDLGALRVRPSEKEQRRALDFCLGSENVYKRKLGGMQ